ncbi:unnamed protein product [Caenorhabditis auriculariae]|uniref:Uncharacterized protein n=1 Tax=Caenorhabditis auriculariae TaxID=2777116 RepID=A0A8S1H1Q0_9PELO|nr:unnamed protein product [Caenorhabditis auriculariae]
MSNVLVLLAACFLGARAISLTPEKALEEMIKWDASHPPVTGPPSSNLNGNAGSNGNGNANNGSNPNPSLNNSINSTNGNASIVITQLSLKTLELDKGNFTKNGASYTSPPVEINKEHIVFLKVENAQREFISADVHSYTCPPTMKFSETPAFIFDFANEFIYRIDSSSKIKGCTITLDLTKGSTTTTGQSTIARDLLVYSSTAQMMYNCMMYSLKF